MTKNRIAAGIVLFNPDAARFSKCLQNIAKQVVQVFVFDNGTKVDRRFWPSNVIYITENKNVGLSYALNRIMEAAESKGFDWLITLDQDSIVPEKMIDTYDEKISQYNDEKLGIITSQIIDRRRAYMQRADQNEKDEAVEFCITSGSCTSISAWRDVDKFDEWLFIDLIDNDFCKRLRVKRYKIIKVFSVVLDQQFGEIFPKNPKVQKFWISLSKLLNNENVAKLSYSKKVNPMRVYYTNRNIIYLNKKLKAYGKTGYINYSCKSYFGFLLNFCIPSFLRADNKKVVLKAIIKGIHDGITADVYEWKENMQL